MVIHTLTPEQLKRNRPRLLRFSRRYGDKRITHRALSWLSDLNTTSFSEGTYLAVARKGTQIVGLILFGKYGLEEAYIVVHPEFRNQHIGESLLGLSLEKIDRLYVRVATDNLPSLKLCFAMNFTAFHIINGPTGKPTLCLGGGKWSKEEFIKQAQ